MPAYLHYESWAGHSKIPVEIIRETLRRFKVRLLKDCMKGKAGRELYVPKYAVSRNDKT